MITTDGARSLKRLHAAKKALALITDMDLPAKASLYEGFRYKVWQQGKGDLSGGRVVAPLGALVLYSSGTSVRQFVLDSFETAAAEIGKGCSATAPECALTELEGRGLLAIAPLPAVFDTAVLRYNVATDPTTSVYPMPLYTYPTWKAAQPVATPRAGEMCYVNHVAPVAGGVGSGPVTSLLISANTSETHCYSRGRTINDNPPDRSGGFYLDVLSAVDPTVIPQVNVMTCLSQQTDYWERMCVLPGIRSFKFAAGALNNVFATYTGYYAPTKSYSLGHLTINSVLASASSSVRTHLANQDPIHLYGAYTRTTTDVKGIAIHTHPGMPRCAPSTPPANCVADADMVWGVTLAFVSLASGVTTKTASDYYAFMESLFLSVEFDWAFPQRQAMIDQYNSTEPALPANLKVPYATIFGSILGWPNAVQQPWEYVSAFQVIQRRDTVTFPDEVGDFYSWVRDTAPNGFRFSASIAAGIERKIVNVPAQVLSDISLRPCIFLAASGVYYCVADNAAGEIKGIHIGSPFGAWEQIPLPTGATMYLVRMVSPPTPQSPLSAVFIGVGKTVTPAAGEAPEITAYRVYFRPAGGDWAGLSPIPVSGVNDAVASWDVCVFGDDPLAQSMQNLIQQPVARAPMAPAFR